MARPFLTTLVAVGLLAAACAPSPGASSPAASGEARTITVTMTDDFHFEPDSMTVRAGESVRFEIVNAGALVHEFLIGDAAQQAEFEEEMGAGDGMAHDNEAGVSVEPGETEMFTFTFGEAGELFAGCHQVGHYDAGMVAIIQVE